MKKILFFCLFFTTLHGIDEDACYKICGGLFGASFGSCFGRLVAMNSSLLVDVILQKNDGFIAGDQQLADIVLRHALVSLQENTSSRVAMEGIAHDFISWAYDTQGGQNNLRFARRSSLAGCYQLDTVLRLGYQKLHNRWWASGSGVSLDKVSSLESDIGSAVHAYPFGVVFYDQPGKAAQYAAEHSLLTHRSKESRAACAAMAAGIAVIIQEQPFHDVVEKMVLVASKYSYIVTRAMKQGLLAAQEGQSAESFIQQNNGSSAADVMAVTLYLFSLHKDDLFEAFIDIAKQSKDPIATAINVGALIGAYSGYGTIDPAAYGKLENFYSLMDAINFLAER